MKKILIITVSIICSLFFFGCSKDDNTSGKKEESELFNVKYEVSVDDPTFFENYRLHIGASVYDNGMTHIEEPISNNYFVYEFKSPKGSQYPIIVKMINKHNKEDNFESKANITVKVFLNGKLALKETNRPAIFTVFTDLLYMN